MDLARKGQVTQSAADIYDEFFVPALFSEWAPRVVAAAGLTPGLDALDVACGTGVLAREALVKVCSTGHVVGLDCNDGMLATAARRAGAIDWRKGQAEHLPFADASFDAVISQFGLMFFDDPGTALREMWRVLRPGGRLAVAVWAPLDQTPGYRAMTALIHRLFGARAADALRAPYSLGDPDMLRDLFLGAGISGVRIDTLGGAATFPSIAEWVRMDVKGWTLADLIDEADYRKLQSEAARQLADFTLSDGTVSFRHPAHIASAVKQQERPRK